MIHDPLQDPWPLRVYLVGLSSLPTSYHLLPYYNRVSSFQYHSRFLSTLLTLTPSSFDLLYLRQSLSPEPLVPKSSWSQRTLHSRSETGNFIQRLHLLSYSSNVDFPSHDLSDKVTSDSSIPSVSSFFFRHLLYSQYLCIHLLIQTITLSSETNCSPLVNFSVFLVVHLLGQVKLVINNDKYLTSYGRRE